jgi:hypothetical protein
MKSTSIKTLNIKITPDQVPLNLYQSEDNEYKFFPDIGETVREDGILCAFRTPNKHTFVSDMTDTALKIPRIFHDMTYMAPAGSTILDVEFYINRSKKNKTSKVMFNQVYKYIEQLNKYHEKIVNVYNKELQNGYEPAPEFNTLVTKSMAILLSEGFRVSNIERRAKIRLMKKRDPVEFIQMNVTYMHDYNVSEGYKLTGRIVNQSKFI